MKAPPSLPIARKQLHKLTRKTINFPGLCSAVDFSLLAGLKRLVAFLESRRPAPPDNRVPGCVQCGGPVEQARKVYVIPTCYGCLPPPEPLPVRSVREEAETNQAWLEGQAAAIRSMLRECPEGAVIDRISLTSRLHEVEAELEGRRP